MKVDKQNQNVCYNDEKKNLWDLDKEIQQMFLIGRHHSTRGFKFEYYDGK